MWLRLSNPARYLLIAAAALLFGILISSMLREGPSEDEFFGPGFWLLLMNYSAFHMISASIVRLFSFFFSPRVRSGFYLAFSVFGFLASLYVLQPRDAGGIHLFVVCWGSLVLIALDHFWRISQQGRSNKIYPPAIP